MSIVLRSRRLGAVVGVAGLVLAGMAIPAAAASPTPGIASASAEASSPANSASAATTTPSAASTAPSAPSTTPTPNSSAKVATPAASASASASTRVASPAARAANVAPSISLATTTLTLDSLKTGRSSGTLSTHQANVGLEVYVNSGRGWRYHARTVTGTNGTFPIVIDHALGWVGTIDYQVRWGSTTSAVLHVAMTPYPDFTVGPVSTSLVYRTYHSGCPVTPAMLTRLGMTYYGFDGHAHTGYLVVRSTYVKNYEAAFSTALASRFPIRQMHDPSVYGNDEVSMANDNTYAFYCRRVSGNPNRMSPHSYGTSVDINTVENPYEEPNGVWKPANGASYVNRRTARPGMFFASTPFTRSFLTHGFTWLGSAGEGAFDYQHFQIR